MPVLVNFLLQKWSPMIIALYQQVVSEALKTEFLTWPFLAYQEVCSWSCVALEEVGEKVSETFLPSGPL